MTSAPYHPASNGLAERAVQVLKTALMEDLSGDNLETQISRFLFHYRITPHSTTWCYTSRAPHGPKLRSRLDLLYPNIAARVWNKQLNQKENHDQHCRQRELFSGQVVWVRNPATGRLWVAGTILEVLTPSRFKISLLDSCIVDWHIDHVRRRAASLDISQNRTPAKTVFPDIVEDNDEPSADPPVDVSGQPAPQLRWSARDRRPPERLM